MFLFLAAALMIFAPFVVSRGVIHDLFFILTMLTLAQSWNLLAGYAGLISVGQQLFVGCGGYALFGVVILTGLDPVLAVLLAGLIAA
ncbi:branched-chain amino acid ABC transporter permease, partial [Rhizobium ruizarguesonis]